MMRVLNVVVLALLALAPAVAVAVDCRAQLLARLAAGAPGDIAAVSRFASRLDPEDTAAAGMLSLVSARPGDATSRLRAAIDLFPDEAAARLSFQRVDQVSHVGPSGGLGHVLVELSASPTKARGMTATLEYLTTRMDPNDVAQFEFLVPGSTRVADVRDRFGNLYEFKNLNWDAYNPFTAKAEFDDALIQVREFILYGDREGKNVALAFKNSVPASFSQLLEERIDAILGDLKNSPRFSRVDGF